MKKHIPIVIILASSMLLHAETINVKINNLTGNDVYYLMCENCPKPDTGNCKKVNPAVGAIKMAAGDSTQETITLPTSRFKKTYTRFLFARSADSFGNNPCDGKKKNKVVSIGITDPHYCPGNTITLDVLNKSGASGLNVILNSEKMCPVTPTLKERASWGKTKTTLKKILPSKKEKLVGQALKQEGLAPVELSAQDVQLVPPGGEVEEVSDEPVTFHGSTKRKSSFSGTPIVHQPKEDIPFGSDY